jgi:hypothetical protein
VQQENEKVEIVVKIQIFALIEIDSANAMHAHAVAVTLTAFMLVVSPNTSALQIEYLINCYFCANPLFGGRYVAYLVGGGVVAIT